VGKVKIDGKEYTSLSLSFFNAAMEVIHDGNEYSIDYVPRLKKKVIAFSEWNQEFDNVLITTAFYRWMDSAYAFAEECPLPWRPTKGE